MPSGIQECYPFFKPCVYLVKMKDERNAVLKLTCDYDNQSHRDLCSQNHLLAPEIFGYEIICNRYHVILMEYLDFSTFNAISNHLANDETEKILNRSQIFDSLKDILEKLKTLGIVHGDFRSVNILAKKSGSDPSILEDFKLIDFEWSGKLNEPYPFLALKSREINWPNGVNSYMPKKFEHDLFMLDLMRKFELKIV